MISNFNIKNIIPILRINRPKVQNLIKDIA